MLLAAIGAKGQSAYLPNNSPAMHMLDRFEIKSGRLADPLEFTTTTRAYQRQKIAAYVDSFDVTSSRLSKQDYFNLDYLQNDNFEWSSSENTLSKRPILKKLGRHKAAVYDHVAPDFNVVVNAVAHLQMGYDTRLKETATLNARGMQIRGSILKSVGFFTEFIDEINKPNSWVLESFQRDTVIPGVGLLKTTDYRTFNYGIARGYITFNTGKNIDFQFGHGSNFIGNGYRTFYMSDYSRDHLFLRINTRVWKLTYTNIFGQLYDYQNSFAGFRMNPTRHYYAATHAAVNVNRHLNIGLFQCIVFQRDSGYSDGGYDLQYLNPIIFYKPIENGLNSPDKAILGGDIKYNFMRHFSLYGQITISELILDEIFAAKGWWGNKYAGQLGLKYIDALGIKNLDLQGEYNFARPYMYTSYSSRNAYTNYRQNMAHPLGANFREMIGIIRYQPANRLFIKATGMFAQYGNDTNGSNWGKNISYAYYSRPREYGNEIGQGVLTNLYIADLIVSYMVRHNIFIDLQATYRKTGSQLGLFDTEALFANIAFRWNIGERRWDF